MKIDDCCVVRRTEPGLQAQSYKEHDAQKCAFFVYFANYDLHYLRYDAIFSGTHYEHFQRLSAVFLPPNRLYLMRKNHTIDCILQGYAHGGK